MLPRALDIWLPAWLRRPRAARQPGPVHLLLCVCDHFEPFHGAGKAEALNRVGRWRDGFPQLAAAFRDSDGEPPRHTFFYPVEQYDPDVLAELASLCHATRCETEIHLHHDNDTVEHLRETLEEGKARLRSHGLLSTDDNDAVRYGFIHGNWALDHSHPEGRACGVANELTVLRDTGCYADFTMPSAPDRCQTRTINSLYYATDTPAPKSHDTGVPARAGKQPNGDLLLVQGPLGLNWRKRKLGVFPRIENGDLTAANPPTADRLRLWRDIAIHVGGRPDWIFVKLHTHGGSGRNLEMLLGEPMRRFHEALVREPVKLHYVTAREMVNILHAAEDGKTGGPGGWRDYKYRL
jgi:hypothetical protein